MTSSTLEQLPGEPIIVLTMYESFSAADDLPEVLDRLREMLDSAEEPIYFINETLQLKVSLSDIINAASLIARGEGAIYHHPNMKEVLVVTDKKLIGLSAEGLRSDLFGNVPISVFETLEEALDYVRSR